MTRREVMRVLAVAPDVRQGAPQASRTVLRAAQFLWSRQADDGGWHSSTYGLMRSGQSLTPFVLDSLLQANGVSSPPPDRVRRAIAFIRHHTDSDGAVGRADPDLADYPNYATAYAVLAIARARPDGWREMLRPMAGWLRGQQFTEQHGWARDHPVYGAWGMGGPPRRPPHTGQVDLSMTRAVLEALAAAGAGPDDPAFTAARVYLGRSQNVDGGFFFSTVIYGANKAGRAGNAYRSYGTATADGLLSLLAAGCRTSDPRVRSALAWLRRHDRAGEAPGFIEESQSRWKNGLWFYYAAVSSEAFARAGGAARQALAEALKRAQRDDGSWVNAEGIVKEDDPLIATALALRALSARRLG